MRISSRLASVTESITMAIAARAAELKAEGRDVISLSAGEPDFDTPDAIRDRGVQAIRDGATHYTAAAGTRELRAAVAAAIGRDYGLDYAPGELLISAGSKPAIHLALCALLEPGEGVVVLAPYWVSYPPMVGLAGGRPVIVAGDEANGFLPDMDELEQALAADGVRGIIVNSPCNPTGAVWPEDAMKRLVEICARHDRWIISDEIYTDICYGDTAVTSPANVPGGRERTVVVNGFSKAFAMTGWRLGWLAGPSELVGSVIKMQSQLIGNPCSISQEAALEAVRAETRPAVAAMVRSFAERRDVIVGALSDMPGLTLRAPEGAFYAFPGVRELAARRGTDDVGLTKAMLDEISVAVVPGSAFGAPGHVRLSYAASLDDIHRAIARLREWLED